MKSRLWALVFLFVASLLVLAVAGCDDDDDDDGDDDDGGAATATAAGGGDEDLSLYFRDLAAIQEELNEGISVIDEQSQAGFADPAAARQSLNAVSVAGQAAYTDLTELEVPPDATDAHAELEDAGETYLSAVDSLADELQNISAGAEFDTWVDSINEPGSEYTQAKEGLQQACADMQTLADENDVDVALDCPV